LYHLPGLMLTFGGSVPSPFTAKSQIWYASIDPPSTHMCQISSWLVYSITLEWQKTPSFAIFWTSAFCGVDIWQGKEKAECRCTTTNLPLYQNCFCTPMPQRRNCVFGCHSSGKIQAPSNLAEDLKHCSFTAKHSGVWCIVSPLRCA